MPSPSPSSSSSYDYTSGNELQPTIKFSDFMDICFPHIQKDVEVATKKGSKFVPNSYYYTGHNRQIYKHTVKFSENFYAMILKTMDNKKAAAEWKLKLAGLESFTQQDTEWTDFTMERRIDTMNGDYDIYFLNPKTDDVAYITSEGFKMVERNFLEELV
jgi:hypothetical protein